ncbi:hypothetical protein HPB49_026363 [Dermacentor silvarum]|nr:hypothetical protein HPB49_026363 [Dermacentor silvarum]
MFDHVVGALPPVDRPDDHLKVTLIQRTTDTEQHKLQQLLTSDALGDRKPTHLFCHMQALAGDRAPQTENALLRGFFLQRLQPQVRMILAESSSSTRDSLAQLADKIIDVAFPSVATVHRTPDPPSHGAAAGDNYARLL